MCVRPILVSYVLRPDLNSWALLEVIYQNDASNRKHESETHLVLHSPSYVLHQSLMQLRDGLHGAVDHAFAQQQTCPLLRALRATKEHQQKRHGGTQSGVTTLFISKYITRQKQGMINPLYCTLHARPHAHIGFAGMESHTTNFTQEPCSPVQQNTLVTRLAGFFETTREAGWPPVMLR